MSKILIIDDDRTTVKLLRTLLELDGFEVYTEARGKTTLESVHAIKPDAFLVDFHLIDMKGTELIKQLRAEPIFAQTPVIMASGQNVKEEALEAGANVFLIKPFEPSQLSDALIDLIG